MTPASEGLTFSVVSDEPRQKDLPTEHRLWWALRHQCAGGCEWGYSRSLVVGLGASWSILNMLLPPLT